MTCPTCQQRRVVMITHSIVINRRRITWSQCAACEVKEMRHQ